ncbi:MAG: iron-containing alcohol dehydrogenase [Clostridiales bacterium]|nr:iron-containing alcohol dehydrogenase [Clostridiales bacterium]
MSIETLLTRVPEALRATTAIRFPGTGPHGKLLFGCGASRSVGEEARSLGARSALLVADPTIVALGMHRVVLDALNAAGIACTVFSDVAPEPDLPCLAAMEAVVRAGRFDLVVGFGGGSAMDVAKLAACLAVGEYTAEEIMRDGRLVTDRLPTILMPTTAGTGSEVSPYIVVSADDRKLFIGTPYLYATIALVDPLLTATMPARVTAATGLDALSHGAEGACGCPNPYTLATMEKCAELAFRYLPRAVADGDDLEARYYMSFAAVMGMLAYTQGGGLYAHSAAYVLTTEKHLPHGAGCGLALPYTLQYNFEHIGEVLDAIRSAVNRSDTFHADDRQEAIGCVLQLVREAGMPATLAEVGYAKEDLEGFAQALVGKYYRAKNPRPMSLEEARLLAEDMLEGRLRAR